MDKELAILVIHGMGSQGTDFAEPMIKEVNARISQQGKEPDKIAWKAVFWADILEDRQLGYLRAAKRSNDLDYIGLRKFIITAIGDASAYQQVESAANTTYQEIHERVRSGINELYLEGLSAKPKPLLIMAHSLGGHIMSNYIWDMQKPGAGKGMTNFERMRTLAGMVTFGCNIPLFTFAYKQVIPIKFPAPQLPAALKKKARWLNYYDPDDVLGYPLRPINPAYSKVVSKDVAINVGGLLSSWNPASHSGYWTDNNFTKPVSRFIASFL